MDALMQDTLDAVSNLLARWMNDISGEEIRFTQSVSLTPDKWVIWFFPGRLILSDREIRLFNRSNLKSSHNTDYELVALAKANLFAIDGTINAERNPKGNINISIELDRRSVADKIRALRASMLHDEFIQFTSIILIFMVLIAVAHFFVHGFALP